MFEAMFVLFVLTAVALFSALVTLANISRQWGELWQAWQELGRKEALAGRGPMNSSTGLARQAYLYGWQQVFVERGIKKEKETN
jgi:hypothetical protein